MANTIISQIAARIIQNKSSSHPIGPVRVATDVYPGQYCVMIAGIWTLAINSTASHKLIEGGVVDWKSRQYVDSSNDRQSPSIDSIWDIDEETDLDKVPMVTSGVVACFITDQSATVYPGAWFMVSATAGSLTRFAVASTGATSGTAITQMKVAKLLRKIASGDLRAIMGIGEDTKRSSY